MSDPKRRPDLSDVILIPSRPGEHAQACRAIALWLFVAFDIAGLLFLVTGVVWWFLLPWGPTTRLTGRCPAASCGAAGTAGYCNLVLLGRNIDAAAPFATVLR